MYKRNSNSFFIITLFTTVIFVQNCIYSSYGDDGTNDGGGGAVDKTGQQRKLSLSINPGCISPDLWCSYNNGSGGNGSLIHIRSDSASDSLHFVWNFFGSPTLLLARTPLDTNLSVNWDAFIMGKTPSVSFQPPDIYYSFGTSLVTIWTFNDENDQAFMDKVNQTQVVENKAKNRSDLIRFTHTATKYLGKSMGPEGYIKITVQVRDTDGYCDILPYMLHNGNSSQVDISFNKVHLNYSEGSTDEFKNLRVGLGYMFVHEYPKLNVNSSREYSMKLIKTKELDDEHTPGVFEMYSLETPVQNKYDQSYLEWKPIAYTGVVRDITDSIDVQVYPLQDTNADFVNTTFLWSFYGQDISRLIVQSANITFGSQGDGFCNSTTHISWTYMTGYGPPPTDSVSMIVILTLAIGLGIPAIIIIISVIYLISKRLSKPQDELLLGR